MFGAPGYQPNPFGSSDDHDEHRERLARYTRSRQRWIIAESVILTVIAIGIIIAIVSLTV